MYLVVFRNRKRADIDQAAYDAEASLMVELAEIQPGFLSFKSFQADDGEVVAISEWVNEAAARAWGQVAEHCVAQANGRGSYYSEYTLYAWDNPRMHQFQNKEAQ